MNGPAGVFLRIAFLLLAGFLAASAAAQSPGTQRRPRTDMPPTQDRAAMPARLAPSADPVIALDRELPSLRTDLALDAAQQPLWGPFERSVRDAAELTRQRTKKMMAPRPVDAPVPSAAALMATLAGDERMRADAIEDASARLKPLYEALTPTQRSMFDRRVLLSQSEPLGVQ
jgi:hypothetical protein